MAVSMEVTGVETLKKQLLAIVRPAVKKALEETMEDLRRCASGFAPKDTGHLESSGRIEVRDTKTQVVGAVTYSVTASKANYALIMHEGFYNLGVGSQGKSGGTSKFGTVSHSVGRKYLTEPFHQLLPAYVDHIAHVIRQELN